MLVLHAAPYVCSHCNENWKWLKRCCYCAAENLVHMSEINPETCTRWYFIFICKRVCFTRFIFIGLDGGFQKTFKSTVCFLINKSFKRLLNPKIFIQTPSRMSIVYGIAENWICWEKVGIFNYRSVSRNKRAATAAAAATTSIVLLLRRAIILSRFRETGARTPQTATFNCTTTRLPKKITAKTSWCCL